MGLIAQITQLTPSNLDIAHTVLTIRFGSIEVRCKKCNRLLLPLFRYHAINYRCIKCAFNFTPLAHTILSKMQYKFLPRTFAMLMMFDYNADAKSSQIANHLNISYEVANRFRYKIKFASEKDTIFFHKLVNYFSRCIDIDLCLINKNKISMQNRLYNVDIIENIIEINKPSYDNFTNFTIIDNQLYKTSDNFLIKKQQDKVFIFTGVPNELTLVGVSNLSKNNIC